LFKQLLNESIPHISSHFQVTLSEKLLPEKKEIKQEISQKLEEIENIDYFKNNVPWIIKDAMESRSSELLTIINDVARESSKKIEDNFEKFKEIIQNDNILSDSLITHLFKMVHTANLMPSLKENINQNFTENGLNTLVKDNTFFLQRWFNTKGGLTNVQSALQGKIYNFMDESFDEKIIAPIQYEVSNNIKKIMSRFEAAIKTEMENLSRELKIIIDNFDQRKERILELEKVRQKLEKDKNRLMADKDETVSRLKKGAAI